MSEVKVYRVSGKINKPNLKTEFSKEIRAIKPEDAVEKVYTLIGSKHRVRRFQMSISKVEEIGLDEIEDLIVKKLTQGAE
ncbi:MAG: 50S ribosomal protein L18a [Candidatus Bathyarchaeota archaeon]|nr:50S ribosomal protein L18Ae [Candidatus Bathyarchaeum tardum]WGM89352.1 MAG: 50S ribosomal protein L18Ae [Candidatus Bathyarchaeum tardum]WNZ28374.1 MAG: 50S ribosomal protein L18a [Candidatus Bathyarchaeota archaeon]